MRCTELRPATGRRLRAGLAMGLALLGGCSRQSPSLPAVGAGTTAVPAGPAAPAAPEVTSAPSGSVTAAVPGVQGAGPTSPHLPPPGRVRDIDDLRRQAAHRIVAANPHGTYLGPVPAALLAIPVLEIELRHDGSVARISVLRAPRQARDTTALAMAAVHRAAPFGDVSHLRPPWRFTETFLFDDDRKFKLRILDE